MRTKTLLLTAALSAAGVATSMAQVYSVNAVGYVNKTIKPGLQILVNQLNTANNTLNGLFPVGSLPNGTQVFKFNQNAIPPYQTATVDEFTGEFDLNLSVNPGEGFFMQNNTSPAVDFNIVFVGEVPQGAASNQILPAGRSLGGGIVPQGGSLTALGAPGVPGDQVFRYVNNGMGGGAFNTTTFDEFTLDWDNADPVAVAEGFFIDMNGGSRPWNRNFNVNP